MNDTMTTVDLERLLPHPDNPNRMSRVNLAKLTAHIERTGCYEPLVVRFHPARSGYFQIINGHHRCEALRTLGHTTARVVIWDVDDEQTDLLLTTLNRLTGRDMIDKKLAVLRRLTDTMGPRELSRWLPHTAGQLERLTKLKPLSAIVAAKATAYAIPMLFFVTTAQKQVIEAALHPYKHDGSSLSRSARRADALAHIARTALASRVTEDDRL